MRIWELLRGRDGDAEVGCVGDGEGDADEADEVEDVHFGGCEGREAAER